jgi:hypothetical protein
MSAHAYHLLQRAVFEVAYMDEEMFSTAAILTAQAIDASYPEWKGAVARVVCALGESDGMCADAILAAL